MAHRIGALAQAAIAAALFATGTQAFAVALTAPISPAPFADTFLPGTTAAARPELAGTVLADELTSFSFSGITGTVQNRVVRETTSGTLDFYWKVNVDERLTSGAGISAFRLGNFGVSHLVDADWRIDGLGTQAPDTGRVFAMPGGYINFLFEQNPITAGQSSTFFFLHTDAVSFAKTAQFDLLCNSGPGCMSGATGTFAPAVPEPETWALGLSGLLIVGGLLRRRGL